MEIRKIYYFIKDGLEFTTNRRNEADEYYIEFETTIKKNNGTIPVSIKLWVNSNIENKPIGFWVIVSDITQRKFEENVSRDPDFFAEKYSFSFNAPCKTFVFEFLCNCIDFHFC